MSKGRAKQKNGSLSMTDKINAKHLEKYADTFDQGDWLEYTLANNAVELTSEGQETKREHLAGFPEMTDRQWRLLKLRRFWSQYHSNRAKHRIGKQR